jgi:hypothetical protein
LSSDQSFITRARAEIFGNQQKRAIERRREKIEQATENAEVELFLDTCAAEGLDKDNPRDLAIMLRAWCLKKNEPLDDNEMERDHDDITF